MGHTHASDRLPSEDAAFLYLESQEMPLHIGSVMILEGEFSLEAYTRFVAAKLPLIPRYRQRVVFPPLHLGHPTWEDDPEFDIVNHVQRARLERGTLEGLRTLAGQVFSKLMDRRRPLWDLLLVHGLRGGRSAVIARVHHCLVDGVSGVGILNVMLNPDAKVSKRQAQSFRPLPLPTRTTSLIDAFVSSSFELVERAVTAQSEVVNFAEAVVNDHVLAGLNRMVRLAPEFLGPVEPLPFNKPCSGRQNVAWTEITIPSVNEVRATCGGTLNDVVLTILTAALSRYARFHKQTVDGRLLRLMVPVNLRRDEHSHGLGNRVSLLPLNIPLDIRDPVKLLDAVRTRTEAYKAAHVGEFVHLFATLAGATPAPLQALLEPLANILLSPPFNLVCTNVPGPPFPLYVLGHVMLTTYPYVPIGNVMGMNCAVQSYNDKLYFGLTGDVSAAPDLDRLKVFIDEAFADLYKAAGLNRPQRRFNRSSQVPSPLQ